MEKRASRVQLSRAARLFGDWVKRARQERRKNGTRRWTLEKIAKRIGVTTVMLWYWSHGKRIPCSANARAIEQITGGEISRDMWDRARGKRVIKPILKPV